MAYGATLVCAMRYAAADALPRHGAIRHAPPICCHLHPHHPTPTNRRPRPSPCPTLRSKPENILLSDKTPAAALKVIDFGTSDFCLSGEHLQHKFGTPYYVAPEVLKKHYDKVCVCVCGTVDSGPYLDSPRAALTFIPSFRGRNSLHTPSLVLIVARIHCAPSPAAAHTQYAVALGSSYFQRLCAALPGLYDAVADTPRVEQYVRCAQRPSGPVGSLGTALQINHVVGALVDCALCRAMQVSRASACLPACLRRGVHCCRCRCCLSATTDTAAADTACRRFPMLPAHHY
jgi:hypothetical protein